MDNLYLWVAGRKGLPGVTRAAWSRCKSGSNPLLHIIWGTPGSSHLDQVTNSVIAKREVLGVYAAGWKRLTTVLMPVILANTRCLRPASISLIEQSSFLPPKRHGPGFMVLVLSLSERGSACVTAYMPYTPWLSASDRWMHALGTQRIMRQELFFREVAESIKQVICSKKDAHKRGLKPTLLDLSVSPDNCYSGSGRVMLTNKAPQFNGWAWKSIVPGWKSPGFLFFFKIKR